MGSLLSLLTEAFPTERVGPLVHAVQAARDTEKMNQARADVSSGSIFCLCAVWKGLLSKAGRGGF